MAGMKKKATPRGYGSSKSDREFAKTTGPGKTAQVSRGMNIYAKENIPKGYTVQKVNLKGGKTIAVVGLTKSASAARMVTSQPSGYQNPNQGTKKPARGMARGAKIGEALPRPNNPKGSTNRSSGYLNPNAAGNRNKKITKMTIDPNTRVKRNPFKKSPRSK